MARPPSTTRSGSRKPGLADLLVYDAYERRSFLVRALDPATAPRDWAMASAMELGDAVDGAFTLVDLGAGSSRRPTRGIDRGAR